MVLHKHRHENPDMGIIRSRKIYFAILAHINEEALAAQVENIRRYNPEAGIIVYNGGTDPDFAKKQNVLLYPGAHPIRYGNLTPYFWEIMKWLEDQHVEYEYLINLDHDVLFIKDGFMDYLENTMDNYDVMGWHMVTTYSPADTELSCCHDMWKEWDHWGPFFNTGYFIRYLNSTQVYRHGIIRRMLEASKGRGVENKIAGSNVFALEEMFFVTFALSLGARIREYPREDNWRSVSRFGHNQITKDEVRLIRSLSYYHWIHPVKEDWLIEMNRWLANGCADEEKPAEQEYGSPGIGAPPQQLLFHPKKHSYRKPKGAKARPASRKKRPPVKLFRGGPSKRMKQSHTPKKKGPSKPNKRLLNKNKPHLAGIWG